MKTKNLIYSIQEHKSRKLHWDLRLEMNGVLKSWAIPKKPTNQPNVKRLLIETEDHQIDFAFFEGTIPEGQYGAGNIKLYDKEKYDIIEYEEGKKYIVNITGKELNGTFIIVKTKEPKEWLIFKKG